MKILKKIIFVMKNWLGPAILKKIAKNLRYNRSFPSKIASCDVTRCIFAKESLADGSATLQNLQSAKSSCESARCSREFALCRPGTPCKLNSSALSWFSCAKPCNFVDRGPGARFPVEMRYQGRTKNCNRASAKLSISEFLLLSKTWQNVEINQSANWSPQSTFLYKAHFN